MSTVAHHQERRLQADFARNFSEEEYRVRLTWLLEVWGRFNSDFFGGRLIEPHLGIGRTAPRSLGHCSLMTVYGALLQIVLSEGLVFGVNRDWVIRPWPSEGVKRFLHDLLLRLTVRQYVLEVREAEERGYDGYGPLFTEEANRIGLGLGLGPVVVRRRAADGPDVPVCKGWPHNVRLLADSGYYGDDVTEALLDLATGGRSTGRGSPMPPSLGELEYFLFLLCASRQDQLRELLARQVDRLHRLRERQLPVLRRAEAGKEDTDGSPLGAVTFDPAWLRWNNRTIGKMVEAISEYRAYAELPILADALEDAGCVDGRILRHLRAEIEHTARCWVLCGLRDAMGKDGEPSKAEAQALGADNNMTV